MRCPLPRRFRSAATALVLVASTATAAELDVVTSTPDLAALVAAVGGERVEVTSLARGTEDPHYVDPRPSLIVKLNRADALVEGGAELEIGWLPRLVEAARNSALQPGSPGRIRASEGVALLEVPTGSVDRSMGDVHAAGNPHYLLDPRIAGGVAERIAARLAALDPDGADGYRARAAAFSGRLSERIPAWKARLAPLEGRAVFAYHKTFEYLAGWLGFDIVGYVEPKPGLPPNPQHVAELTARARALDGPLLIVSTHNPRAVAGTVAGRTGARLVELPTTVGAEEGVDDYEAMIERIVERLEAALGGEG